MRTLVIGDIHGEYEKLMQVLSKANWQAGKDTLIFLGDYIDRGPNSYKVVQFIKQLKEDYPELTVLLKGNHEDMALRYINKEISSQLYAYNGGMETLKSYEDNNLFYSDIKWLNKLPLVHETEKYIFVHAGLMPSIPLYQQKEEDMLWIRDEFLNHDDSSFDKVIIHGHTAVKEVETLGWRINLDTGAGKGGKLSLLDMSSGKIYQD